MGRIIKADMEDTLISLELDIKEIQKRWQTTISGLMLVGITTIKTVNSLRKVYGHLDLKIPSPPKHNQELLEAKGCLGHHHQDQHPSHASQQPKIKIYIPGTIVTPAVVT